MFARTTTMAALMMLTLGMGLGGACAENGKDARQREAVRRAKVTLSDAVSIAQRALPGGRVVDTDVETIGGRVTYAIEIQRDGLKTVLVDLESGRVLSVVAKRELRDRDDDDAYDDDSDDDDVYDDDRRRRR